MVSAGLRIYRCRVEARLVAGDDDAARGVFVSWLGMRLESGSLEAFVECREEG